MDRTIGLSIKTGQAIVLDNLFFDFSEQPVNLNYEYKNKLLYLSIKNLLNSQVSFKLRCFYLKANMDNVTALLDFLKDSYETPALQNLLIKGKSSVHLQAKVSRDFKSIMAILNLKLGQLNYQNITLKNLKLDLPVLVNYTGKKTGHLSIESIKLDNYTGSLYCNIKSKNNLLTLNDCIVHSKSIKLKPFKILVNLKNKSVKIPLLEGDFLEKRIKTHVKLSISYLNGLAKTYGFIKIKAFDGVISIKRIRANLKDVPIISMDIVFKHINLKKLTENTNFGLVTGYVEGYIKNLSLVNFKYPLSFEALVKTENVKGVSKRISLKAVNSISSVGGGLASIAVPFFKNFPYSVIGFKAILKNNRFEIHGLYKDGKKEYIVKKGFLIGVDVVNMNSNNSISWQDFLNRL